MGDMQGKSIKDWGRPMPANMEPTDVFAGRADGWWERHIVRCVAGLREGGGGEEGNEGTGSDAADDEKGAPMNILVVSHGGLIRALLSGLLRHEKLVLGEGVGVDVARRMRCANASITVIEVDASGAGRLVQLADTRHLEVEQLVVGNVDVVEDDDDEESRGSSSQTSSHVLRN